jgi:hypothetical protein
MLIICSNHLTLLCLQQIEYVKTHHLTMQLCFQKHHLPIVHQPYFGAFLWHLPLSMKLTYMNGLFWQLPPRADRLLLFRQKMTCIVMRSNNNSFSTSVFIQGVDKNDCVNNKNASREDGDASSIKCATLI